MSQSISVCILCDGTVPARTAFYSAAPRALKAQRAYPGPRWGLGGGPATAPPPPGARGGPAKCVNRKLYMQCTACAGFMNAKPNLGAIRGAGSLESVRATVDTVYLQKQRRYLDYRVSWSISVCILCDSAVVARAASYSAAPRALKAQRAYPGPRWPMHGGAAATVCCQPSHAWP